MKLKPSERTGASPNKHLKKIRSHEKTENYFGKIVQNFH